MNHTPNTIEHWTLNTPTQWPGNARQGNLEQIKESMRQNGVFQPVLVQQTTGRIIAGNHRHKALQELHREAPDVWPDSIPVMLIDVDDDRAARIHVADNKTSDDAGWDTRALVAQLDDLDATRDGLLGTGFDDTELADLRALLDDSDNDSDSDGEAEDAALSLEARFGVPPFTVLDRRQGYWLGRKKAWKAAGIESNMGRDEGLVYESGGNVYRNWMLIKNAAETDAGRKLTNDEVLASAHAEKLKPYASGTGTSTFDPFLAELMYRWFSPDRGHVVDPWAGGSVRGIVASALGRSYTGIDLSGDQITANEDQVSQFTYPRLVDANDRVDPVWVQGDSRDVLGTLDVGSFDMAFGCPPYYDLEEYSEIEGDLSALSYPDFDEAMAVTLEGIGRVLKDDSFACFVVGSVRATKARNKSQILDMRACMTQAAERAGMWLYHDMVLIDQVGTSAMRAPRGFELTRMVARTHQEVLIFVKGDRRKAVEKLGAIGDTLALNMEDVDDDARLDTNDVMPPNLVG